MKARSALRNFILWASLAIIVNIFIYFIFGSEHGLEFLGGYIIELSLSVDNLFLFLIIFTSFNIPILYQKRVLTYGIIGAIILRFLFIFLGVAIVNKFHWILYIFGFFLFCSGLKIFLNNDEKGVTIKNNFNVNNVKDSYMYILGTLNVGSINIYGDSDNITPSSNVLSKINLYLNK